MPEPDRGQLLAPHVVPPGCVERSGYVPMGRITLGDPGRLDPAAVTAKYQSLLHLSFTGSQPSPPIKGYWRDDEDGRTFVVIDGRHRVIALAMLGYRTFLVAWVEAAVEGPSTAAADHPLADMADPDVPPEGPPPCTRLWFREDDDEDPPAVVRGDLTLDLRALWRLFGRGVVRLLAVTWRLEVPADGD